MMPKGCMWEGKIKKGHIGLLLFVYVDVCACDTHL